MGNYLRMFRGKLYKRFPGLERRTATDEEREEIKRVSGDPNHVNLPASVSLLRADEVTGYFFTKSFVPRFSARIGKEHIE